MLETRFRPHTSGVGVRQFFGLTVFALCKGIPCDDIVYWRHNGRVWVPWPDVVVGTRSGWSMSCIEKFEPHGPQFNREPIRFYWGLGDLAREHHLGEADVWAGIAEGSVAAPVVWVDDHPGWPKDRPVILEGP